MNKIIIFILFFLNTQLLNALDVKVNLEPRYNQGQIITLEEWSSYMDYCFLTYAFIYQPTYGFSGESQIDMNYRFYEMNNGQMVLGVGELILWCMTETEAYKNYSNTNTTAGNTKGKSSSAFTNNNLKRSRVDKCNGFDHFDGYWFLYECNPNNGSWRYVPDSVGGSFDEQSQTFECYNPNTDNFYQGSSYVTMHIIKSKFLGVEEDLGFFSQSYACSTGQVENERVDNKVEVRSGMTTSKQSTGLNQNTGIGDGSSGSGGSTGGSNSDLTPKLEEIQTDLTDIKNQNSNIKTEVLGKVSEIKADLLLDNQNIKVTQNALNEKIDILSQQNLNLKEELKSEIEQQNQSLATNINDNLENKLSDTENTIKNNIEDSLNLQSSNLKLYYEEQNQILTDKLNSNETELNNLKSMVEQYNQDDINSRNEVLTNFSNLENQLNGISSAIENLGSNSGNNSGSENEDLINSLNGLNSSINTLNQTTQSGLIDENDKPYLKSLNENISVQNKGLDDNSSAQNEINSSVGNELGYALNKYSNLFGSGFCSAPQNINVSLLGQNYTLLDFSVLNPYVDYIRTMFLSIAYLLGLFLFLRGK